LQSVGLRTGSPPHTTEARSCGEMEPRFFAASRWTSISYLTRELSRVSEFVFPRGIYLEEFTYSFHPATYCIAATSPFTVDSASGVLRFVSSQYSDLIQTIQSSFDLVEHEGCSARGTRRIHRAFGTSKCLCYVLHTNLQAHPSISIPDLSEIHNFRKLTCMTHPRL
jgi:hypothetical protein